MESIDAMLVHLTLQGDANAFARLIAQHQQSLLNFALSQVGDLSEAEDIVQEAFISAYQHLTTLREPEKFAGWIYQIVRNRCYAVLRERREKFESISNVESASDLMTPDKRIEGYELSDSIIKAVATLPAKSQSVFLLYLEGWSYRDIATTFDLSTSTVLGRIQRSKRHLKEKVSKKDTNFAPLQIDRGYLREEIYKMSEGILMPKALTRRIYGIETEYNLYVEWVDGKPLLKADAAKYIFKEIISGRMYPDVFLENGARFYQDRGPVLEYATPECDSIAELVAHEKAGERILEKLTRAAQRKLRDDGFPQRLSVYKNTTGSYGCHDNYLMSAHVTDDQLLSQLIPFLVTRQIFAGSGKVRIHGDGDYAISQRAEYLYHAVSGDSTARGIINHRNDQQADASKYRRLHITVDDANMSEVSTYLKVGTTGIVVRMLEDGFIGDDLALNNPVNALKAISSDPTCTQKVELANGKSRAAIEIQREYLELAKRYFDVTETDAETEQILKRWDDVLTRLADDPMQLDREIDWVIKKRRIESEGVGYHTADAVELDLLYHNIHANVGLYRKLEKAGDVERIVTDEQIDHAIHHPPQTTRAKHRAEFVKMANQRKILCGVNWSYIRLYEPYQKLYLSTDIFSPELEEIDIPPEEFQQRLEAFQASQEAGA